MNGPGSPPESIVEGIEKAASKGLPLFPADDQEYVIVSDDNGHHFVCPAHREDEANQAFESARDGHGWEIPDFLDPIGGSPTLVKFKRYRIE